MAKLGASFNFNRGSTFTTDDYAGNGNVSEGMTDVTIGSGVVGNTAIFNGATSTIKFGNILDAGGLDTISCLVQIKKNASKDQMIFFKDKHVFLELLANDIVRFNLFIGVANTFLDSIAIIGTSSTTIECVYDGIDMFIYIDGVLDNSKNQVGNLVSSSADFAIGHLNFGGDSLFFDGEIEVLDFRIDALIADQVSAWHDNPLGTEFIFQKEHNLSLGDIVGGGKLFESLLPQIAGSVSFEVDDFTLRIKPIQGQFNLNEVPVRRANIFDVERQWVSEFNIVNGQPILQIKDRIKTLADSAPSVNGSKGFKANKDAFFFRLAICPDFVIETATQVGSINDFNPTDLEFANTIYISSTSPVNWTGLNAPVDGKRQLIFIVNVGNFNITIRNNNASSLEANRFAVNANVILSSDDCGFLLYDFTRARWRVNKI